MAIQDDNIKRDLMNNPSVNPQINAEHHFVTRQNVKESSRDLEVNQNISMTNPSTDSKAYTKEENFTDDLDDLEDASIYNDSRETKYDTLDDDIDENIDIPASVRFSDPASGFPGGGPYRTHDEVD